MNVSTGTHEKPSSHTWGWLPILTLITTLGVFSVAHAFIRARLGGSEAAFFFWLGLLMIFVPATIRLLSAAPSRCERICLLCIVGTCFYLVNVMYSPLYFSGYDEFLHWRTTDDITSSGHLFQQNILLPVSPFYPGLEIVTNALESLSGLSTFVAGTIVVGVARLVMILSLFLLYERVTKSARVAGLALIIYMTNPHFLFFDAQFAYESLALPLVALTLFIMTDHELFHGDYRWITCAVWLLLAALTVTHHATDFILDGFLLLWATLYTIQQPAALRRSKLVQTALFGIFISLVWIHLPGNPVVDYFSSDIASRLTDLLSILKSISSPRHLFTSYSATSNPFWERVLTLFSAALISAGLLWGLIYLWRRYQHRALVYMFGIISLLYPLSLALHLTNFGVEISDRLSAFLFIPLSCVVALFINQFWSTRQFRWKPISLVSATLSVIFIGSIILGNGPTTTILPGPYRAATDTRSIEPEGIQDAIWARSYLGPNNRMATDITNQLLMSTFGEQRLITTQEDHVEMNDIFFSPDLGEYEKYILQRGQIRYLVVDLRLSQKLPDMGYYYEEGEPDSFRHSRPIDRAVLTKFNTAYQINRVFDSGDIIIYAVGGQSNAP